MKIIIPIIIFFTCTSTFAQIINVSTSTELQNALNSAAAGQMIVLADGIYYKGGGFKVPAGLNGTNTNPITLKGSKKAILTNNDPSKGYSIGFAGNNYWIIDGFTLYASQKGIVIDNSHHNIIQNLTVNKMGYEGIHLRTYSSFNTVQNCYVDSMGLVSAGTGEGIYIGSANSNWGTYTGGNPDTCNYNSVLNNSFGDHIGSENIDIKEGTTGGYIAFNTFNGKGLNGVNSGDSWIDVKGNYYRIECNTGNYTLTDGFQSHIAVAGWGNYNLFSNNILTINTSGYGINIQTSSGSQNSTAPNNIVCSNNTATGAGNGLTNITASTNCTGSCTTSSCTATITSSSNSFCTGGSIVLTASTGTSYKWFNGITQVGTASTFSANTAGSYTVEVTNSANCKATSAIKAITVDALPTATITSSSNSFCTGSSVLLTGNTGNSYKWFNGTTQVGTASTFTANAAGSYTVEVTNAASCKATSAVKTISVTTSITWYADTDKDGKGDPTTTLPACTQPTGYVSIAGDGCPNDVNKIAPGNCGCNNTENSCLDCAGVPNGTASMDVCMICSGGTTGISPITDPNLCSPTTGNINATNTFHIEAQPNPFNDKIELTIPTDTHIQLIDMNGKIVYEADNTTTVSTSQLANGLYVLRISTINGTSVLKVLKQ